MKATEHFTRTIEAYLNNRAETDNLFAVSFNNPDKNMADCITFILNSVKASGCVGFEDSEIFSMAVHYWDENDINIGNPISCNVVINHVPELTDEEKQIARQNAIKRLEDEAYTKMKSVKKRPTINQDAPIQTSLFDL